MAHPPSIYSHTNLPSPSPLLFHSWLVFAWSPTISPSVGGRSSWGRGLSWGRSCDAAAGCYWAIACWVKIGVLISRTVEGTVFDLLEIVLVSVVLLPLLFALLDGHRHQKRTFNYILDYFQYSSPGYDDCLCAFGGNSCKSMKMVGGITS